MIIKTVSAKVARLETTARRTWTVCENHFPLTSGRFSAHPGTAGGDCPLFLLEACRGDNTGHLIPLYLSALWLPAQSTADLQCLLLYGYSREPHSCHLLSHLLFVERKKINQLAQGRTEKDFYFYT